MAKTIRNIFIPAFIYMITTPAAAQGYVNRSQSFQSEILNRTIEYSVYLPENYSHKKVYPVLYLLHGVGGDETSWEKRFDLQHLADSLMGANALPEVVIVMPDGKKSYYINDHKKQFPYEDFFVEELIPFIDSNYNTDKQKDNRGICGLSMGGFGATILPLKHPDIFGTSMNLSGAIRTSAQFIAVSPVKYHSYFAHVFGDSLSGSDRITEHWKENSPYYILDSTNADTLKTINWYIDCGMQDYLFPANKAFHELLLQYRIPHVYHMRLGEHSWSYWRKGFINAMVYWGEQLK